MRISRLLLTIFVILQAADGLITFGAVQVFGPSAEGNPILQTWMLLFGALPTLVAAKLVACGLAALLYAAGRQKTLAVLTTLLVVAAVGPWLAFLQSFS